MNAHARRAGFSKPVSVGGVLAGFCLTEVLDGTLPRALLKALPTQSGAAELLTPEPCRVSAQSRQEFPLEALHRLQCYYLHILVSVAQAVRGLSLMWPHSFQRSSHCEAWEGCDLCGYISSMKQPKKWPLIRVNWQCLSSFWRKGVHTGALLQPWPFAGLAGTSSHSEHMGYSCLNSCSVTGHVQPVCLLEWWAFSYPVSSLSWCGGVCDQAST